MTVTESELSSLRQHLGYGAIGLGASTYSPDSYVELFRDVVATYLTDGPETSCSAAIAAGVATVTPASMTGIVPYAQLIVNVGDDCEEVIVKSITATTFTARFARAHAAGCPVAVQSGHARLRMLLQRADQAWQAMQDPNVGATAGLKQVDKGDVEWFRGFQVLKDRREHYMTIVNQLSQLVRVAPNWPVSAGVAVIEAY